MIKKTLLGLLLVVLWSLAVINTTYAKESKILLNPGMSEWGCKLSLSDVKRGIDTALLVKEWSPSGSKTGYTQGKILVRGKHTLVVDINYTEISFDIKYKSSNNLKYMIDSEGVEKIHPNVNSWMSNLQSAIIIVLKRECK